MPFRKGEKEKETSVNQSNLTNGNVSRSPAGEDNNKVEMNRNKIQNLLHALQ